MTSIDLDAYLELATSIAREAASIVADGAGRAREHVGTKSTLTDMVTEVDHASEELIVRRIREARPEDGIIGEEGSSREGTSGATWVIDPLDGTTNFLYGFPAFAVSIAVEVGGEAVVGVVHDVSRDEVFAAAKGRGATLDGRPIETSGKRDLETALVATGFGYAPERRRRQAALVAEVLPSVRDIRRAGSAALDLCWVACGRLDGYFEQGIQHWDWGAGTLIVAEAGGRTGWVAGDSELLELPVLVAAAAPLYEPLTDLLSQSCD